jgi:hypothetical protein
MSNGWLHLRLRFPKTRQTGVPSYEGDLHRPYQPNGKLCQHFYEVDIARIVRGHIAIALTLPTTTAIAFTSTMPGLANTQTSMRWLAAGH